MISMFSSEEIKSLRQDVDALGAQIEQGQQDSEARHQEVLAKLGVIEEALAELKKSIEEAETSEQEYHDDDEMYEEAKLAVIQQGKASTSFIQRKLGIGYARAARLIDALEKKGVIGPGDGAKPREVLIDGEE